MNRTCYSCWVIMALIVLSCIGVSIGAERQQPAPWRLIYGRYGAAVVSDGKFLYVIGGGDRSPQRLAGGHSHERLVLGGIEKIDLATGLSKVIASRVIPRRFHSAVLVGRTVFILGGEAETGIVQLVQALDLDSLQVRTIGEMPFPRRALSAIGVEDLIFTVGGSAAGDTDLIPRAPTMDVYDWAKNQWFVAPAMPEPKEVPVVFHGHHLYALGGYAGGDKAVTTAVRYDLTTGRWEKLAPTPFTLSGYSAVNIGRAIVCFGDYVATGRVAAYLPETDTWRVLDVPFMPRRNSCACIVGGYIYVVGGNSMKLAVDQIERFSVSDLEAAIARTNK